MDKKSLIAGVIAGAIILLSGFVVTPVFNLVFPTLQAEYTKTGLFRPWNDPLMSLYFVYPFLLGLVLAWIWTKTKKIIDGKNEIEKAKNFAVSYWLAAGLPGMFITYSSFQVSFAMILAWSLSGFIDAFIAGWIFAKRKL